MRVVVADDHWIVRETLKQVLRSVQSDIDVIEAATFTEVETHLRARDDIGLLLIDLVMPGIRGDGEIEHLRRRHPDVPIVIISVHEDRERIMRAIQLGAVGYIPKSAKPEEIVTALSLVLSGQVSFPRRILEGGPMQPAPGAALAVEKAALTRREVEVVALLGGGRSIARIAGDLGLSPHTVRVHVTRIMKKLGVEDRSALMHYAVTQLRNGGIRSPDGGFGER
ncbi:Two-component regulatory system response regulator RcsB [Methylorubrum extorquens]